MADEFWTGEHPIIRSDLNLPIEDVRPMDALAFSQWARSVRHAFGKALEDGIPPHDGNSLDEIEQDMRDLSVRNTANFLRPDSETGRSDVIVAEGRNGSFLRSLFTNMSESADGNAAGASLFDFLTADENSPAGKSLCQQWEHELDRIVRRDKMYEYSKSLRPNSTESLGASNGAEWVLQPSVAGVMDHWTPYRIENSERGRDGSELTLTENDAYILARLGRIKPENAGGDPSMDRVAFAKGLLGVKSDEPVFTFDRKNPFRRRSNHFRIRTFKPGEKVFPRAFSVIRTGVVAQGTNFSALTAKFLYQHFTEHLRNSGKEIIVFDPSMGYGGRCLGAMAAAADRPIRYIGTDPNSKHWITPVRSRYSVIADHYRAAVGQKFHAAVEPFCCGSEDVHQNPAFQKYHGQLDLAFTSPPYFISSTVLHAVDRNPRSTHEHS
jgi:hypothetical protein